MTLRNSGAFAAASLALIGTLWFSPVFAQDENPTTPGAIPNPSTYQGSMQLQQQEQQQNPQFPQQQQQQEQSSYPGQPQQGGHGGDRSSQSSGGPDPYGYAKCVRHVADIRALAPIAGKITLGRADPTAVELFDDHSKPTAAEKILLAKWDAAHRYCDSLVPDDPKIQTPPVVFSHSHWGFPATHALLTQLMNGQITFGQFNYQRAMNDRASRRYWEQIQQKH
jgi:hypothetical protein